MRKDMAPHPFRKRAMDVRQDTNVARASRIQALVVAMVASKGASNTMQNLKNKIEQLALPNHNDSTSANYGS